MSASRQLRKWRGYLLLLLLGSCTALDTHSYMLMSCYQQPEEFKTRSLTFDEYMMGQPTRLQLHAIVKPTDPKPAPATEPVMTVATALTVERLEALLEQCKSWPGPLVASLYVPLLHPSQADIEAAKPRLEDTAAHQAKLQIAQLRAQTAVDSSAAFPDGCHLQVIIAYEYVTTLMLAHIIPVNALRNLALLAATTPLVSMIDVDLLISHNLGKQLILGEQPSTWSQAVVDKCTKERAVLILPAFQTPKDRLTNAYPVGEALHRDVAYVRDIVQRDKAAVSRAVIREGRLIKFASQQFAVGHRRTNFGRWYETKQWYTVEFVPQFEPWFIADRLHTPFYDVNFRGYGRNKQEQSAHVHSVGTSFWVHPEAFVVHAPHGKSDAQKDHDKTWEHIRQAWAQRTGTVAGRRQLLQGVRESLLETADEMELLAKQGHKHVKRLDKLFRHFVAQMGLRQYKALLDPASANCLRELPWWKGADILNWSTTEPNTAGIT